MSPELMQVVLDQIVFHANCDDTVEDPDIAVKQLESIASTLQRLPRDQRAAFVCFAQEQSRRPGLDAESRETMATVGESMGLLDGEESAAA